MENFNFITKEQAELCDRVLRENGLIAPSVGYLTLIISLDVNMSARLQTYRKYFELRTRDQHLLLDLLARHYVGSEWPAADNINMQDAEIFFNLFHDSAMTDGWVFEMG